MTDETVFTGLTVDQAVGQACVMCGRDYVASQTASVPVGQSRYGRVYACQGHCAQTVGGVR
jgi:hypothetical protein